MSLVPINDTLQLTEEFSVAFWVKRDAKHKFETGITWWQPAP